MLQRNRVYRILRTTITIVIVASRYSWLLARSWTRLTRASDATWDRAHGRTGRSFYRLATSLGGAYIKLGQILGGRGDFFPAAFVEPLSTLHDQVPPRPFDELADHIEEQLGRPPDEIFESIERLPLAAASLAQVHRGVLLTGEVVAVKVQYPEAQRLFPTDLGALRRAVRVARWINRRLDLRALVDELAHFVVLELDFSREARSTERVRRNVAESSLEGVVIPRVHAAFSSEKLLVLEFLDGVSLASETRLDEALVDRELVARRVASIYTAMIFDHGFFQGDPHPGNFLARDDGSVAMLDFGLAKELPDGFADGVADMIVSAIAGDGGGARAAAEGIGFRFKGDDTSAFLSTLRMVLGDYSDPDRLATIMKSSGIEKVPAEFALIVRAFVLLNGLSHRLVPGKRLIMLTLAAALLHRRRARAQQTA